MYSFMQLMLYIISIKQDVFRIKIYFVHLSRQCNSSNLFLTVNLIN